MSAPWSRAEFEQRLRERGRAYHIHHPFNVMLNSGKADVAQIGNCRLTRRPLFPPPTRFGNLFAARRLYWETSGMRHMTGGPILELPT